MNLKLYSVKVQEPMRRAKKKGIQSGLAFGFSQMQIFLIYAVVFYVGAVLHKYQGLSVLDMFTAIFGIMFATFGMGNNQQFAGDVGAAKNSAKNLFQILDSKDEFQMEEERKSKQLKTNILGHIEIREIHFKYESRERMLFEGLSLVIERGQKVSFVGPSGCGKSTIMQMLLRFYDPSKGVILVDGIDILDYDIRHLRRQLAIVSQEPVLFNMTIKENIIYNELNTTME
jgi:ATP-binding cassette subfamily B (MDR/TAP) protein 1